MKLQTPQQKLVKSIVKFRKWFDKLYSKNIVAIEKNIEECWWKTSDHKIYEVLQTLENLVFAYWSIEDKIYWKWFYPNAIWYTKSRTKQLRKALSYSQ